MPSSIKEERNKRNAFKLNVKPSFTISDKPEDVFYKIHVSCFYRKRIHELLKNLKEINQQKRDMYERWASLKKELNMTKAAPTKQQATFTAVKGDLVDEMWCECLNRAHLELEVTRTAPGKYLFGTRNITCKIVNGKLLVRVGGGYMSADEFIEQYGSIELAKTVKQGELPEFIHPRLSIGKVASLGRLSAGSPRPTQAPMPTSAQGRNEKPAYNEAIKNQDDPPRLKPGKAGKSPASPGPSARHAKKPSEARSPQARRTWLD